MIYKYSVIGFRGTWQYPQTCEVEMKYSIIVEETKTGYSAYSPDVAGCVATGETKDEVERNIKEAIEFHLEGLRLENSNYVDVTAR